MATLEQAGEAGILLRLSEIPSPSLTQKLVAISEMLRNEFSGKVDCAPAFQTLMVQYRAGEVEPAVLGRRLLELVDTLPTAPSNDVTKAQTNVIRLPVYYDAEVAADLEWLAARNGCSGDDIALLHSGTRYHAYANGFAPGFCYLGEVPEALASPRLYTPRLEVPAGSVAIADRQTAVYPSASPGGWRIIGRCPLPLFDVSSSPPNRITVGRWVQFEPIDKAQFIALGGQL